MCIRDSGWAVPSITEHPEDVVKLADFLASREAKLLGQYGIKGRDYTLDKKAILMSSLKSLKKSKLILKKLKNVASEALVLIGQIIWAIQISIIKKILVKQSMVITLRLIKRHRKK